MPIIYRPNVDKPHGCKLPSIGRSLNLDIGTIWECGRCKQQFEFVGNVNGLWERYVPKPPPPPAPSITGRASWLRRMAEAARP